MKFAVALLLVALVAARAERGWAGNAQRGRAIATASGEASCIHCHAIPGARGPAGTLGPPLAGVGGRFGAAALRARIVDASRLDPQTAMPPYGRTERLYQVAPQYRGKPLLSDAQIDDVVAYLLTLK